MAPIVSVFDRCWRVVVSETPFTGTIPKCLRVAWQARPDFQAFFVNFIPFFFSRSFMCGLFVSFLSIFLHFFLLLLVSSVVWCISSLTLVASNRLTSRGEGQENQEILLHKREHRPPAILCRRFFIVFYSHDIRHTSPLVCSHFGLVPLLSFTTPCPCQ